MQKYPLIVIKILTTFTFKNDWNCISIFQGPEGDAAIAMATKSPHRFVAKPQREGGGIV